MLLTEEFPTVKLTRFDLYGYMKQVQVIDGVKFFNVGEMREVLRSATDYEADLSDFMPIDDLLLKYKFLSGEVWKIHELKPFSYKRIWMKDRRLVFIHEAEFVESSSLYVRKHNGKRKKRRDRGKRHYKRVHLDSNRVNAS